MWETNRLKRLVRTTYPLIQAGMAGGPTTPELVAAVSEAGGLGTLGAGYMKPEDLRKDIRSVRKLTDRPFAVNLFIPEPIDVDEAKIAASAERLAAYRQKLGVTETEAGAVQTDGPPFEQQLAVLLEERVPVFSCTFGVPSAETVSRLKENGTVVIGTATTVAEAIELERGGADAIVAQGSEAGGHRGTFAAPYGEAMVGTMALVPQIVDRVSVPVAAAGGIMDARTAAAAFVLGAEGVQMGTAFLTCEESGTRMPHRAALLKRDETSTVVTKAFSGKPARGIRNAFIEEMAPYEDDLPAYPIQNSLTKGIRKAAAERNLPDYMSLWAGQGYTLSREGTAQELVESVVSGVERIFRNGSRR
ncbi:MAG TPA: nitronate monooxygenase [Bacillales bacterium]|nr:nitronate monooxygenase [Bacillales bacterium]